MKMLNTFSFVFLLYVYQSNSLEIVAPSHLNGENLKSPSVRLNDYYWEPFLSQVVTAEQFSACDNIRVNATGRIVLFSNREGSCNLRKKLDIIEKSGAVGAIVEERGQDAGLGSIAYKYGDLEHLKIHVVEIKPNERFRSSVKNEEVIIWFYADRNSYKENLVDSGAMTAFSVIFTTATFCITSIAGYKLFNFIRVEGWRFIPPHICLSIELVTGIFRMIFFAIDPFYTSKVFPSQFTGFLLRLPLLGALLTSFLITFYWHASLQSYKKTSRFLKLAHVKIPLIAIGAGMTIFHFTLDILQESKIASLSIVYSIFFILMMISIALFFFITGFKVRNIFLSSKESSSSEKKGETMTTFIIVSGIGMILYVSSAILFLTPAYSSIGFIYFTWCLIFVSISIISTSQILLFQIPNRKESGSLYTKDQAVKIVSASEITLTSA